MSFAVVIAAAHGTRNVGVTTNKQRLEIYCTPHSRCTGKDGEPAVRWENAQHFHNDLQYYTAHVYNVYDITACVDVHHLLGRTKKLECGVLENLEDRLRSIIESAIAEDCIDLVAAPIFDNAGNREYTRYSLLGGVTLS